MLAHRHRAGDFIQDTALAIGAACRGNARAIEEMVVAQRDLSLTLGHTATKEELFKFLQVEPDELTREHVHYLTAMYQHFDQVNDDEQVRYVADKAAIRSLLRQTKPGLRQIESFLLERRLIDCTRRSRRLSVDGIVRAAELIAQRKDAG